MLIYKGLRGFHSLPGVSRTTRADDVEHGWTASRSGNLGLRVQEGSDETWQDGSIGPDAHIDRPIYPL